MLRISSAVVSASLADLERMIHERRRLLRKLERQRSLLQRKIDSVDRRIAAVGGIARGRKAGGRARNDVSLPDAIQKVLSEARGALGVGQIAEKVQANGYESRSSNFRGIVNQVLVKDKRYTTCVMRSDLLAMEEPRARRVQEVIVCVVGLREESVDSRYMSVLPDDKVRAASSVTPVGGE